MECAGRRSRRRSSGWPTTGLVALVMAASFVTTAALDTSTYQQQIIKCILHLTVPLHPPTLSLHSLSSIKYRGGQVTSLAFQLNWGQRDSRGPSQVDGLEGGREIKYIANVLFVTTSQSSYIFHLFTFSLNHNNNNNMKRRRGIFHPSRRVYISWVSINCTRLKYSIQGLYTLRDHYHRILSLVILNPFNGTTWIAILFSLSLSLSCSLFLSPFHVNIQRV